MTFRRCRRWLALAAACLAPILTAQDDLEVARLRRDLAKLQNDVKRQLHNQQVANEEALRAREELFQRQANELQAYGAAIRALQAHVKELQTRVHGLTERQKGLHAAVQAQNQTLRELLQQEEAARTAADAEAARRTAQLIAETVNASQHQLEAELARQAAALTQLDARLTALQHKVEPPPPPDPAAGPHRLYTIEKGDTLSTIARAAGCSVDDLKRLNGLQSDMIRTGQTLKVPEPHEP